MQYVSVCQLSDIPEGTMRTVQANGVSVLLANIGGTVFATDDVCTHEQCSLGGEGSLDGSAVVCGCHGATFDVTSGKVLSLPATHDLRTYPVKIAGGAVTVGIGTPDAGAA